MTQVAESALDHPFFARIWPVVAAHEAPAVRALRRENLAGLSGRVLEIGAGAGTNFANYPPAVEQVIAVEPEPRLAAHARAAAAVAPVPVAVIGQTAEAFSDAEPFDAVVCSLVLCSVRDPGGVLQRVYSLLRPGGELRFLEHVASAGGRGRVQRLADATLWPRLFGNCHTHRDTERAIIDAGFRMDTSRREWTLPVWAPLPVSELALGRARRP
ncbi:MULTISPECIES: methyltransferase domain-containing protein [unclassified Mycobacterium]|uniref:methyltransferase domain-containing protein n=1 Tax=unclassified Mycobacterium TaxID=2642494 RepID=UPI0007FBDC03|nr:MULTISPECIES: methyltransferase domain-containing protein [unclassified Mycobacterium]OBH08301.1 phosphatidylethanolamine N-methyltransferase [Mycobacterium sp. E2699]OBI48384.1 phosphatidylethanolamine N-methyltransferase [Mycobacterium sp. E787]